MRSLLMLMIALVVTSCGPRYVDYFPYLEDGTCKPCVALLPIKDCASGNVAWDLSEEISSIIKYRMRDNGALFLASDKSVEKITSRIGDVNYFGNDLCFTEQFMNCDFIVAMEIIDHSIVPYERGKFSPLYSIASGKCNSVLSIKVRLRIIDVQDEDHPHIALQEIFESNHMIPRESEHLDYSIDPWGSNAYLRTPFGMAHQRLAKDLVDRIESITWAAK